MNNGFRLGQEVTIKRTGKTKLLDGSKGKIIDFPNDSEVTLIVAEWEWNGESSVSPILPLTEVQK